MAKPTTSSDALMAVYDAAVLACQGAPYYSGEAPCCREAGVRAVADLARAQERQRIADAIADALSIQNGDWDDLPADERPDNISRDWWNEGMKHAARAVRGETP